MVNDFVQIYEIIHILRFYMCLSLRKNNMWRNEFIKYVSYET